MLSVRGCISKHSDTHARHNKVCGAKDIYGVHMRVIRIRQRRPKYERSAHAERVGGAGGDNDRIHTLEKKGTYIHIHTHAAHREGGRLSGRKKSNTYTRK